MTPHEHAARPEVGSPPARMRPVVVAGIMLSVILLVVLVREHWEHLTGKWIYLLLLACPLMHLFMHGGHGAGRNPRRAREDRPDDPRS